MLVPPVEEDAKSAVNPSVETSILFTSSESAASDSSTNSTSEGLIFPVTASLSLPSLQRKLSSCSDSGQGRNPLNHRPFTVSSLTSSPTSSTSLLPNRLNFDEVLFHGENSGQHISRASAFQNPANNKQRMSGTKRKYSSIEIGDGSSPGGIPSQLPSFIANNFPTTESAGVLQRPIATSSNSSSSNSSSVASDNSSFVTPSQPMNKQLSRPNSPSTRAGSGTAAVAPRSRIASIRRESDCSTENEAAHEKLVKSAQQVSLGFEDFCLDDKLFEERKRAKSLTEPISIFTNAFLPQSSSPSPTRGAVDATQKQCYSPSTQQVVRSNIPYSPSPSPTPGSPYHRMRSMSPIAVRQISKRRYTSSSNNAANNNSNNSNGSGLESDGEAYPAPPLPPKRQNCGQIGGGGTMGRGAASPLYLAASPLVRDPLNAPSGSLHSTHFSFGGTSSIEQSSSSSSIVDVPVSLSPYAQGQGSGNSSNGFTSMLEHQSRKPPRLLVDPSLSLSNPCFNTSLDEDMLMADDDGPGGPSSSYQSFCSSSFNDSASTTLSSRANTPVDTPDTPFIEGDISSPSQLPQQQSSASSSRCSSQRNANESSSAVPSLDFLPLCRSFSNSPRQYPPLVVSQGSAIKIEQILRDADEAPLVDEEDADADEKVPNKEDLPSRAECAEIEKISAD